LGRPNHVHEDDRLKEKLLGEIASKAGIDPSQAEKALDAVIGFLKDNPDQLSGLLGGDDEGGIGGKLGGLLGR
jgi:hypothetical protein